MKCFYLLALLAFSLPAFAQVQLYAIVNSGGTVVNLTQWDGVTPFNVSPNTAVLAQGQPNAQIGGTYNSTTHVFTAPAAPTPAQGIIFENSPIAAANIALPNAPQPQATLVVYLTPAATLATLTIILPAAPADNDQTIVVSSKAVTAVTWGVATGVALLNTPAAIVAGTPVYLRYSAQYNTWFRL